MFCRNCGKAISEKDRFCPHCGTRNPDFAPGKASSDLDRDQGKKIDLTDAEYYIAADSRKPKTEQPKKRQRTGERERSKAKTPTGAAQDKPKKDAAKKSPKKTSLKVTALIVVLVLFAGGLGALAYYAQNQRYERAIASGNSYMDAKKYERAYDAYSDAVAIFKRRSGGYEGRAAARLAQKKYDAAEKQLKLAKACEDTTYGKALWAYLYAYTDRDSQAAAQIKQVAIATRINRRTAVIAGRVCRRIGEPNTGIKIVNKALKRAKTKRDKKALYNELIELYVAADKSNDAITTLIDRATKDTGDTSYLDRRDALLIGRPEFAKPSGTYDAGFKVRMKRGRAGEIIYYTTDGSTPNENSAQYTAAITLVPGTTTTIKMIEINANGRESDVVEGTFTVRVVTAPTIGSWKTAKDGSTETATLSWKKVKGVTGYEPSITTVTPTSQSERDIEERTATSTKAVTVLKGTGYRLVGRVRAYVTVDGQKYYSTWSDTATYDNGFDDAEDSDEE